MELYQLKTFVVVADEGHLTRAAERLHLSQPAVSGHVKALEAELGVRLFVRSPRGMRLTTEGEALLQRARTILSGAEDMVRHALELKKEVSGPFLLGLNTDSSFLRVAELFRGIHESHPAIKLELVQSSSATITEELRSGRLDGGFLFSNAPDEDLGLLPLQDVRVFIVGPAAWEDRIRGASLEDLAGMPWVWTRLDCPCNNLAMDLFAHRGLKPSAVAITDSDATRRELVASGSGLGLMHADEVKPLLDQGRIVVWEEETLSVTAAFAWNRHREVDPLIRAVRGCVAAIWREQDAC